MRATPEMHRAARANAAQAFSRVLGVAPTANEVRFLLAEALHDSTFGAGWHGDGVGSNNMGAVHSYPAWKGETFSYTDSHPDGTRYTQTFKKYPSAIDGWMDLVHEFYVRRSAIRTAANTGDASAVATAMVRTQYAEGFGATEAERIGGWTTALQSCLDEIDGQMGHQGPRPVTLTAEVWDPQFAQIGQAQLNDALAPGLSSLVAMYGTPVLIAYPNSWRYLWFGPGLQFRTKSAIPYAPIIASKAPSFGWEQAGVVLGIAGLAATVFFASLNIKPGSRAHA
jgi:hypothetical protein